MPPGQDPEGAQLGATHHWFSGSSLQERAAETAWAGGRAPPHHGLGWAVGQAMSSFVPLRYFSVVHLFAVHLSHIFYKAPLTWLPLYAQAASCCLDAMGSAIYTILQGVMWARKQETIKRKRTLVNKWHTIVKTTNSKAPLGEFCWHCYS